MTQSKKKNLLIAGVVGLFVLYIGIYIDLRSNPTQKASTEIQKELSLTSHSSKGIFYLLDSSWIQESVRDEFGILIQNYRQESQSGYISASIALKTNPNDGRRYDIDEALTLMRSGITEQAIRHNTSPQITEVRSTPNDVLLIATIPIANGQKIETLVRTIVGKDVVMNVLYIARNSQNISSQKKLLEQAKLIEY